MIIVRNTKELEEKYNLDNIPDDELIRVVGGMENKLKYEKEAYKKRTTYPARQLKNIIQQMKQIENEIPQDWNEWQKAKYIYTVLASNIEYNYDRSTYLNQQSSNLSVLLSRKSVCAGYALTFKEMMDRQGIQCEYIRGIAGKDKHAWNVLTINGINIPVDLTWDSARTNKGQGLVYFGNDMFFFENHQQENDEKLFNFNFLSNEAIESIDISRTSKKQVSRNGKMDALQLAVEQTYRKYINERRI